MPEETSRDAVLAEARHLMAEESYIGVVELLTSVADSDDSELLNLLGMAYVRVEDYELAIETFERLHRLEPRKATSLINLGGIFNRCGDHAKAVEVLRKAIVIDRKSAEAYYNLGIAHRNLKQFNLAVPAYREAIRLSPSMPEAYFNLGNTYIEMGSPSQALSQFRRAVQLRPDFERAIRALSLTEEQIQANKVAANPFGRLVTDEQLAQSTVLNEENFKDLNDEEREIDRSSIARLCRHFRGDVRRILDCLKGELEPLVRQLGRDLTQQGGDLRSTGETFQRYRDAVRRFVPTVDQIRGTGVQLRDHELRMKR